MWYVFSLQYATFFFPSCEGVGCGEKHESLYTLPVHPSPGGGGNAEVVVRTWTITSVCGDNGPMEITVQAKVRAPHGDRHCACTGRVPASRRLLSCNPLADKKCLLPASSVSEFEASG